MRNTSGASCELYGRSFFLGSWCRYFSNTRSSYSSHRWDANHGSYSDKNASRIGGEEINFNRDSSMDNDAEEGDNSTRDFSLLPHKHSSSTSHPAHEVYHRRTSDPRNFREKAVFRRDHMYGKHRPLPDAPWRALPKKTYLDDAERLYGRMETWGRQLTTAQESLPLWESGEDRPFAAVNHTEVAKKVSILRDFLRDSLSAARLEIKTAKKRFLRCTKESTAYAARMNAADRDPESLFKWAEEYVRKLDLESKTERKKSSFSSRDIVDEDEKMEVVGMKNDSNSTESREGNSEEANEEFKAVERERIEMRRLQGERASLSTSPATDESPGSISAFPFLRRRAVENESTLDPSLVEWTMRFFPEDDEKMFVEPTTSAPTAKDPHSGTFTENAASSFFTNMNEEPKQELLFTERKHATPESSSRKKNRIKNPNHAVAREGTQSISFPFKVKGLSHGQQRLECSLRTHEDLRRATFDAEGVYYHIRPPTGGAEDEEVERRKPKPVKGSDVFTGEVVKIPWNVVSASKKKGYTSEILRAKERLVRLSRGEDPATIP